ncbi:hypothetical protein [Streptomyces sp. NPDC054975]
MTGKPSAAPPEPPQFEGPFMGVPEPRTAPLQHGAKESLRLDSGYFDESTAQAVCVGLHTALYVA